MQIRLAFLDVDGVLIDSFEAIWEGTNRLLREFGGREITQKEFADGLHLPWEEAVLSWGMVYNPQIHDAILDSHFFNLASKCPHYHGASAILGTLKGNYIPTHLISACSASLTRKKIEQAGLDHLVDGIHWSENKHFIMDKLCRHYAIAPGDCLFVTDTVRDLKCGQIACIGHQVGIVSPFSTPEQLAPLCNRLVYNHLDLANYISSLLESN